MRRQLTRGRWLAAAFERRRNLQAALRAAQRLELAIQRLEDVSPPRRSPRWILDTGELPWMVRVVERRAREFEATLNVQ